MARKEHVAVLMGGWSAERPVSLNSGRECGDALEQAGFRVTRVDVQRDIAEVLAKLRPDVAFNALHGPFGEDGSIQGVLEILDIPYTHSGVLASALAMNKQKAKSVAATAGIPVGRAQDRLALRCREGACPAAALCRETDRRGLVLRRDHRSATTRRIRRNRSAATNGHLATR